MKPNLACAASLGRLPATSFQVWLLALFTLFTTPAPSAERQFLHHHVPPAVTNSPPVDRKSAWTRLDLAIGLPLRNREALTNLLAEIYNPASANYHRYLTPEQFAQRFGPTEADYQAVIHFAKSHGLKVTGTHPNRTLVDVKGTVADIERALHVRLQVYQHPTVPRTFFAPDAEPSLDLAVPVLSVSGLDNYILPHPAMRPTPSNQPGKVTPNAGSGPSGNYMGSDFRRAYVPGLSLTGSGQIIGLLEFDGYYPNDITAYESLAGLPNVTVTNVLVNGVNGVPGSANAEVALDIEMAVSMAPGLSAVIVYEGSIPNDVLNKIATDNVAKQISSSWTWFGFGNLATMEQIFLQYAAQGQSYFNASGDSGAYSGSIDQPADDPNITVVGGTDLTMTANGGAWLSETTFSLTSGGSSLAYPIPSWQQGLDMSANQGSTTMRNVPDVAMVADNVWVIYNNGQAGAFSGTSIATPLWAGLIALVNQMALANGQPTVGFINPAVYAIGKGSNYSSYASGFHDITTGNNENASNPTRFLAVAGYDLCTGWGTPTGSNLLMALALPDSLRITPGTGALFTGPVGGPFSPAAQAFTLTNLGTASLNWSLGTTSAWLRASPSNGTLTAGGAAANVMVSLTSAASNLLAGSYSATVSFTNSNDNYAQSRQFTLAVVTPPVITSQPANQAVLEGETASFTVGTASNALLFFQWQENSTNLTDGGNLAGSTASTLTVSNASPANAGTYSVIVSNAAGVAVSSNALLTIVPSAPVFTLQPTNQTALPGATVKFTVATVGNHPFFYRWQDNGTNLNDGAGISGSASSTLTVSNIGSANAGTYSVIVSNALGAATSTGAVLSVISVTADGVTLTTLKSLAGGNGGALIYSPLAQGKDGNFYGTTIEGGVSGWGTIFKASTNGVLSTLFSFNYNNGGLPYAGLLQGKDGNFYGVAYEGGASGYGTVFRVTTNGALTTLVSFNGNNGSFPVAGLIQTADGNFYGTTLQGGAYGYGTLFRMTSVGALTNLVSFNYNAGAYPSSVLVQGADGNLYGTTENGGASGYGTVFRVTTNGTLTTLVSLNYANGATPFAGLAQGADGNFYGTTYSGGTNGYGTVYKMTIDGTLSSLYSFTGFSDGGSPWGGLVQSTDGNLYGTTQSGGTYGYGTVFRIAPGGSLATLAQFDGYQGANPSAALVQAADGNLYGTTQTGGASGDGVIFRLTFDGPVQITGQPANQAVFVGANAMFSVATFGSRPVFYQWQQYGVNLTDGGRISGSTKASLSISNVTVNDAAVYSVVVSNALATVVSDDADLEVLVSPPQITTQPASQTVLAGVTVRFTVAAVGDLPLSYQWQENGTNLTDGGRISGSATTTLTLTSVTAADGASYSVIVSNAIHAVPSHKAVLTVLPVTPPGVSGSSLHSFAGGSDGAFPFASLVQGKDGYLYGTASGGTPYGTRFKLTTTGTLAFDLAFPGGTGGNDPFAGLVQGTNASFYGSTVLGGVHSLGTVFQMVSNGAVIGIHAFTGGSDGSYPYAWLVQGSDGSFYGTASQGGTNGYGTVFKMSSSLGVTPLYSFTDGVDGAYPYVGLVQGQDGNFYGTASGGGAYGYGTVFQMTLAGAVTGLYSFSYGTDGAYPYSGLVQGTDGNLYGTASSGGAYGYGTVFKITTNGVLTTLLSFNNTNGASPYAGLVQGTDGNFYGITSYGGLVNQGSVFRITANGALTTLLWFNGFNGANPQAALVQASDGSFYGTTANGGVGYNGSSGSGYGVVFQITVPLFISNPFTMAAAIGGLPYSAAISGQGHAAPGDPLTFGKVSGPSWLSVSASGALSGTPANTDIGTNSFVVSLTDTNGWYSTATMLVPVTAPVAPSFITNPFTEPRIQAGQAYSGTIATNATNPNPGDALTFAKVSGPAWLIVATNGLLSGVPASSDAGTNTFIVSVTDLVGLSNTATMFVYVKGPPSFTHNPFAAPWANVGQSYSSSIAASATDPESGETLTFAKLSGPGWLSMAANGALSGTPATADAGTNTFAASVTDSAGLSNTATMYVYVNSAPSFPASPFTKRAANSGVAYSGTIATNATDPDLGAGDTLTFYKVNGPAWLNVAPNGGLSGAPSNADLGANSFLVLVVDSGGLAAVGSMGISVITNSPPSFIANPFTESGAHAGLAYSGTIATNATDPDVGDALTFAKVSGPAWLSVAGTGALSGTPANLDAGTNTFLVSVIDMGGLSRGATMYINVAAPINLGISRQGGQIKLSWTGGNQPYQVQTASNLTGNAWRNVGGQISTNNLMLTPTNAAAYFRIQGQ